QPKSSRANRTLIERITMDSLSFRFLQLARVNDLRRIDCFAVSVLLVQFAIFFDQECRAARGNDRRAADLVILLQSVILDRFRVHDAEEREGDAVLRDEGMIGKWAVYTHTQDLGVCAFESGEIRLEGFHFLRSPTGAREAEERQFDL